MKPDQAGQVRAIHDDCENVVFGVGDPAMAGQFRGKPCSYSRGKSIQHPCFLLYVFTNV